MISVQILAKTIKDVLKNGVSSANDFVALAIAGELLRRLLPMADRQDESVLDVFSSYEKNIKTLSKFVPDGIDRDLDSVLSELVALSRQPILGRDIEEMQDLLVGLDEVLSVAAAGYRAGALSSKTVEAMGEKAESAISDVVPLLGDVWDFAYQRDIMTAPDPVFPGLYKFWEAAGEHSIQQTALDIAAARSRRKKAVIEQVLSRVKARERNTAPAASSWPERALKPVKDYVRGSNPDPDLAVWLTRPAAAAAAGKKRNARRFDWKPVESRSKWYAFVSISPQRKDQTITVYIENVPPGARFAVVFGSAQEISPSKDGSAEVKLERSWVEKQANKPEASVVALYFPDDDRHEIAKLIKRKTS